jgi:hypothetical protein
MFEGEVTTHIGDCPNRDRMWIPLEIPVVSYGDHMCREQEIGALLEPVRKLLDGSEITDEEREYYRDLLASLSSDLDQRVAARRADPDFMSRIARITKAHVEALRRLGESCTPSVESRTEAPSVWIHRTAIGFLEEALRGIDPVKNADAHACVSNALSYLRRSRAPGHKLTFTLYTEHGVRTANQAAITGAEALMREFPQDAFLGCKIEDVPGDA